MSRRISLSADQGLFSMKKPLLATTFLMVVAHVYAQVDIVESTPIEPGTRAPYTSAGAPVRSATALQPGSGASGNTGQGELFYQFQVLREEVLQLRGMIEEQAYEIKRLKQQRMDDYVDLDRRLSALSGGTATAKTGSMPKKVSGQAGAQPQQNEDGRQVYRNAIDLVLKQKDYDQAIAEFNNYLTGYPTGHYAANAQYWLGEIYLLKNDLEQSRQWFARLVGAFPDHNKAPDAKFKLGKVYNLMGNKAKAQELLQDVASSSTDAGRLARNYLKENF